MQTQEKSKSKKDFSEEKKDTKSTNGVESTNEAKITKNDSSKKTKTSKTTTPKSTKKTTTTKASTTKKSTAKASTAKASTTKASTTKASTTKASTTKKSTTKASTTKSTTSKENNKSSEEDINELKKDITDKKNSNDSKKSSSRKTSRVEKQLKINLEEKKEISKDKTEKIEEKPDFDKLMEKFATQRVSSIKDELEKSSIRKLEAEMINSHLAMKEDTIKTEDFNSSDEIDIEEEFETEEEDEEEEFKKPKKKLVFKILRIFLILAILGIAVLVFLLYGPWKGFRDWYVATAMTTMNHQWLATMFYSQETIDDVLSKNKISEVDGITDSSLIGNVKEAQNNKYANEYEKAVLEKDPNHEDYKIIDIKGKGYNGYLAVVYDASKIHTMVTSKLNVAGEYVTTMAKNQGAVLAINGGGFDDPNYSSNGGSPTGITFSRGKLITNRNNTGSVGGVIGFTKDNILTIGKISVSKAEELGIRDAVTCGPFLIINGKSSEVLGNGGWGDAARTVIGQRQDGIVLMLVLNGRNYATGIIGADMDDLIEIMQRYGAYNAACLDGGTSSVMVENGEILNDPIDGKGRHQTRLIPTAFGLFLNE